MPTPQAAQPAAGGAENPYASPGVFDPVAPRSPVSPGGLRRTLLDFGEVFRCSWDIFKVQWGMCLGTVLLGLLLGYVGLAVLFYGPMLVGAAIGVLPIMILMAIVGYVAGLAFMLWMMIGVIKVLLQIARGEPADLGLLFSGASHIVPVFLTQLLLTLMGYGIMLVCMVPGFVLSMVSPELGGVVMIVCMVFGYVLLFILMLMFSQAQFLVIDQSLGVIDALTTSKKLTDGNKLTLFLIWLACFGLYIVSAIPCGLGLFVSIPFFGLMFTVVYLQISGQPVATATEPAYRNEQ